MDGPSIKQIGHATLALVAALAVAPPGSAAQGSIFDSDDHLWVVGDVRVPPVADTFALVRVERYPSPSLGVMLRYDGPLVRNLDLSIYVYPMPQGAEDPVRSQFDQAVRDIYQYAERRRPPWTVTIDREEPIVLTLENGEELEGMVAEGEYFRSAATGRTRAYVFAKDGMMLKYRITHAMDVPDELDMHVDAWIRITASRIRRHPG